MLQENLNRQFSRSPWGDRACAIVLAPELETWVWSNSPHVDDVLGWKGRQPSLRTWLKENGWMGEEDEKPERPKEAFHAALRESQIARSASLYMEIAQRVSLGGCRDDAFLELQETLQNWFPWGT